MRRRAFLLIPLISLIAIGCDRSLPEPQPKDDEMEEEGISYIPYSDLTESGEHADSDIALVQRIKQALVSDNTLSYKAKNISIRTRNGIVTLEGIVRSDRERALITGKIRQMYEVNGIENRLEVARQPSLNP